MNTHPYLRAYLAGIFVPTLVLPLLLTVFIVVRIVLKVPVPIEQAMIFPMAIVPSLFGLWNMLWLGSHERTHLPIGLHGPVLPLLMGALRRRRWWPAAWDCSCWALMARPGSKLAEIPYALIAPAFLVVLAGYYLVWKYIVGSLNRMLEIA